MPQYDHTPLALHGRLVHDTLSHDEIMAADWQAHGAPAYEIGVEIDGVFVPIFRRRNAAGLLADIARVKAQQRAGYPSEQSTTPEG